MRVYLMVEGQEGVSWNDWVALARVCEESGLEGLFRSDHYLSVMADGERESLDAWATLSALAALTDRIRLGTLVSPVTFRRAGEIAKVVATVDHISAGRVELGLGAGWNEREHQAFGFDFPALFVRMGLLEQQLAHVTRQWEELPPAPVQRPHPPLIIGGSAGPRSSALAARYADEYNTIFATVDECRERRARIDAACRSAGRPPIAFSLMTGCVVGATREQVEERADRVAGRTGRDPAELIGSERALGGTVEEVVERLREYERVGVERVFLQHLDHADLDMVRLIGAEVAPSVG
ncbi:MAG TPA: LLM class flavin-dependent oxidoreductase [Gaiellaceae bacterium]|nr:LLM class flavin-dependent oxidoreductase [Gaiellaceae bacterium]